LRLAEGKYVYFMDADDILDEDALEVLYSKAEENELDVLYFSADSFYETEELQKEHGGYDEYYHYKSLTDEVYDGGMLLYASAKEGSFRVGPPLQFLNREYLEGEGISFREDILFEDELFSTFVLLHAKRAMRIKDVLYQRRVREASAMTGKRNRKHFDSIFLIFTELLRESMSEKYTSVQKEALYQKMLRVSAACRRIYRELPAVERTEILQKLPNSHQFLFEHLEIWHKSNDLEARRKKDRENPLVLRRSPTRVRVRPLREADQLISDVAVSVIIPMFNCEEYVEPLLDSLLQQTLQDMEIICADDGSSDQTADKVRQYMEKDARVSYYYQENTGAGAARNLGLKHAKGAYVIFLDADDLYQEDLLEKLYEAAERNQADVTTCWYTEKNFWENSSVENLGFKTEVIPKRECFAPEEVNNLLMAFTQGPINKMFSRQFIEGENMLFSETRIANDVKFTQLALIVSSKIACVRENLITVRKHVNENSISSNRGKYTPHAIRAYRELYSELQKRGLAEEYETQICNSVGSAFHYNGRFSQDGTLFEALAEWLKEEPWTKYSRKEIEKYLRLRGLPSMERRRKELQKAFAEHSDKATEVQITFLENEIANVKLMCTHLDGIFNNTVSKQEHVIPNEIPNKTVKVRSENINRAPFLVRKTRGALQCWEDHGFIYTVKHFFRKVINKLTR
ncbi:MAG: glycosyltransferase, partial [Anaerotignum sp.]|nr:glycosyltransferase [Anaerotignum sp.]